MSLEKILNAESVAIVGASKNETKRGFQAIRTLLSEKYDGQDLPGQSQRKKYPGVALSCESFGHFGPG